MKIQSRGQRPSRRSLVSLVAVLRLPPPPARACPGGGTASQDPEQICWAAPGIARSVNEVLVQEQPRTPSCVASA